MVVFVKKNRQQSHQYVYQTASLFKIYTENVH